MPLRNYWAEHTHVLARNELWSTGTHQISFNATVPTSSHIKKLIFNGGITIRGGVRSGVHDLETLGLPMVWQSEVYMAEPGSDHYPSGRIVYLNKQAGELVTSQQSQGFQVVPYEPDHYFVNSKVVTWYSGHVEPVNQGMSYGSVDQSIGDRTFGVNFYVHGTHPPDPPEQPPYYSFSCAFTLRVLYERTWAGGIVWG